MTNAEARFNNSLRPRKPEGSLGRTAQDGHLDSRTAPELSSLGGFCFVFYSPESLEVLMPADKFFEILKGNEISTLQLAT